MTTRFSISLFQVRQLFLIAVLFAVGCIASSRNRSLSFAQMKALSSFTATIESSQSKKIRSVDGTHYLAVEIRMRRDDEAKVVIATNQATVMQAAFAQNLVKDRFYEWSKVLTDFEQEMKQTQRANYRNLK